MPGSKATVIGADRAELLVQVFNDLLSVHGTRGSATKVSCQHL